MLQQRHMTQSLRVLQHISWAAIMNSFLLSLKDAQKRTQETKNALNELGVSGDLNSSQRRRSQQNIDLASNKVYQGLLKLSPTLGNSYAQVLVDIDDTERISWPGTAAEL